MFKNFIATRKARFSEQIWQEKVANQDASLLYAPHFDGKRFFNPWMQDERPWRDMAAFFLEKKPIAGHGVSSLQHSDNFAYLANDSAPDSVTWLGHASIALQLRGQLIVMDPFLSQRAFTIKRQIPATVTAGALPQKSLLLISHNHYDHLDKHTIKQLAGANIICPVGMAGLLAKWGACKVTELDWWQSARQGDLEITFLPAHHWSKRLEQKTNCSLWGSFLIESNGKKIYFGGDSAYFVGYREFGRRFADIDVAILPCGAYSPRWFMHSAHMDVAEMFKAFSELGARRLLPMHWGGIMLGHEELDEPGRLIADYVQSKPELAGKVLPLIPGQRILLDER